MDAAGQRATERLDVDQMLARMPAIERYVPVLLERIGPFVDISPGSRTLDIGAAQGQQVIALQGLGLDAGGAARPLGDIAVPECSYLVVK